MTNSWEKQDLSKICNIYDGIHETPKYVDRGIEFISVENIQTLQSQKYISKRDFLSKYKILPEYGDIFMTRIGTIGEVNVYQRDLPVAYYVSLALLKNINCNQYFLKYQMYSPRFKFELSSKTNKNSFPMIINKEDIKKLNIFTTSQLEEQKLGSIFNYLDNLITFYKC
ncbi:restriction endonuclease subunit S domain-containing protein [Mycoplasma sp. VS31B]